MDRSTIFSVYGGGGSQIVPKKDQKQSHHYIPTGMDPHTETSLVKLRKICLQQKARIESLEAENDKLKQRLR